MIKQRTRRFSFKNINVQYESRYKRTSGKNSTSKITLTTKFYIYIFFNYIFSVKFVFFHTYITM